MLTYLLRAAMVIATGVLIWTTVAVRGATADFVTVTAGYEALVTQQAEVIAQQRAIIEAAVAARDGEPIVVTRYGCP